MKGGNPISGNDQQNVRISPEFGPVTLNIKVTHGLNDHEVAVPSNSTFGDLKSILVQKLGLNPETHKLLFRGKYKEDDDVLLTAGVKDNSKVLLMEDSTRKQSSPEKVMMELETNVISVGGEAVAKVREEVDKLADKVSALQVVVDGGTKVDEKDILYMIEMLMRQLLKLDGIEAEGEGKMQRRTEVRRVQSMVETMDLIKSRNSNPFINGGNKTASVTTAQWETFEPGCGSVSAASSPANLQVSTPVSPHTHTSAPFPSHAPTLTPSLSHVPSPTPMPYHAPSPTPMPYHVPSSTPMPYHVSSPTPMPYHVPSPTPMPYHFPSPTPMPYTVPSPTPMPYTVPSPTPMPYNVPSPTPLSSHTPTMTHFQSHSPTPASPTPTHVSSLASSRMPSSTKVTQDWEHFD